MLVQRAGIVEVQEIEFRPPRLTAADKDKKDDDMHIAKWIRSSWICSPIELQQLKHGFSQPAFWQYICCKQPCCLSSFTI
jgi:hypothetical protein